MKNMGSNVVQLIAVALAGILFTMPLSGCAQWTPAGGGKTNYNIDYLSASGGALKQKGLKFTPNAQMEGAAIKALLEGDADQSDAIDELGYVSDDGEILMFSISVSGPGGLEMIQAAELVQLINPDGSSQVAIGGSSEIDTTRQAEMLETLNEQTMDAIKVGLELAAVAAVAAINPAAGLGGIGGDGAVPIDPQTIQNLQALGAMSPETIANLTKFSALTPTQIDGLIEFIQNTFPE